MANFSKSSVPQFSVEVYQNEYLPEGGREVNAIVTVTSTGGGTTGGVPLHRRAASASAVPGQAPSAAVVIMVDCSGSMDYPPTKMRNARDATAAAIDTLRDGVAFAVVAGTHVAKEVYPGNGRLAVADARTRAQAKEALRRLSRGRRHRDRHLAAAGRPAARHPPTSPIRHGILLTDGRNEHETPEELRAALDACAGRFTCDARGVGTDWEVKEVTGIASALLGTADIVADPAGLAADFTRHDGERDGQGGRGRRAAAVDARSAWRSSSSSRWRPTVEDLTGRRTEAGPRAGDYPTGSWGDESRDYHVCVRVPEAGDRPGDAGGPGLADRSGRRTAALRRCCRRGWYGRCGRTTWRPPPRSTRRSRTTPARPNWRRSSSRAWMPASRATSTARRRNWAARCSWRRPRGTRTLRNCFRRWWTSSMRRRVLCD